MSGMEGELVFDLPLTREAMPVGEAYRGPLIIEEDSATTVVPPGWVALVTWLPIRLVVRRSSMAALGTFVLVPLYLLIGGHTTAP